ncbi:MAG: hypothetical protein ACHQVS_01395 [Candidatus Babeliales bacterium]
MILTFLGFLYALGLVYVQYPEIVAYSLNLVRLGLNLKPVYLTLLSLLLPYNLQAAGPKAPPPVLINVVPTPMGFESAYIYFTGKYMVRIDKKANTVTVYDVSDPQHPELISTNEYEAKIEAGAE